MSVSNRFLDWCESNVAMPAICVDQDQLLKPKLSQVCGLLILPFGAAPPSSWVVQSDMEGIIDNSVSDNSKAKYIAGKGGVDEPEEIVVRLGKRERKRVELLYTLEIEFSIRTNKQYTFLQKFQRNYKAFRFWYTTTGGRLLGGAKGITPHYIFPFAPLGSSNDDVEKGIIRIQWFSDAEPSRTSINDFYTPVITDSNFPEIMFYQQSYEEVTSATLTWTENSGTLPTSNTDAQVWVYQNGQKLDPNTTPAAYTINHNTAAGESEIVINSNIHFSGASYEVQAFVVSS